jgi:NAD(P)-dependent dehydrogenase (short-subunit alcohol dehydrogenase family)
MSFASGENEFETEWFKRFFVNPERPRIPIARPGRPEEIAEGILFFANPRNSYCTGQVLEIDGGLTIKY